LHAMTPKTFHKGEHNYKTCASRELLRKKTNLHWGHSTITFSYLSSKQDYV